MEPPLWSSQAPNSSLSQVRECMQPSMKGAMLGSQLVYMPVTLGSSIVQRGLCLFLFLDPTLFFDQAGHRA